VLAWGIYLRFFLAVKIKNMKEIHHNIEILKLKTFDHVFKKSFHSKEFEHAYNEEMARFELANQRRG
jgi:hypothetical protein